MDFDFVFFKINGKLEPLNKDFYQRVVSGIREGDKVSVSLKSFYRDVDNSQLNVFYFYCRLVAEHTGSDFREVAEAYKILFGIHRPKKDRTGKTMTDIRGNVIFVSEDISEYNVRQMSEFLDKVRSHIVQELRIPIPEKKEVNKINF